MSTAPNTVKKAGKVATMEEIRAAGVIGNAFQDMPAMTACGFIAGDENEELATRLEAVDYINNDIMGLDLSPTTEEELKVIMEQYNAV